MQFGSLQYWRKRYHPADEAPVTTTTSSTNPTTSSSSSESGTNKHIKRSPPPPLETGTVYDWFVGEGSWPLVQQLLCKHFPTDSCPHPFVLDVGCGNSALNGLWHQFGYDCVCSVDYVQEVLQQQQAKLCTADQQRPPTSSWVVADATRLPFRDCTFDYIFAKGLLDIFFVEHHYRRLELVLMELSRVLRPAGTLLHVGDSGTASSSTAATTQVEEPMLDFQRDYDETVWEKELSRVDYGWDLCQIPVPTSLIRVYRMIKWPSPSSTDA